MKKNAKWNKWLILPFSIILVVLIIVAGNRILTSVIQNKIGKALRHLSSKVQVHYASIHANLFESSASINDLKIDFIPYSNAPRYRHSLHFNNVTLTGINFYKVILGNTVFIRNVSFNKADIKLDPFLLAKKDSGQAIKDSMHVPFKHVAIANMAFAEINVWLHAPPADQLLLRENMNLHEVEINNGAATNTFTFKSVEGLLTDINYALPHDHYTISIKKLMLNSNKQKLVLDSLKIIAENHNTSTGNKTSRMNMDEATASSIEVTKFNLYHLLPGFDDDKHLQEQDPVAILVNDLDVRIMQNDQGHLSHHSVYCKHLTAKDIDFAKTILHDNLFVNTIKVEGCDIRLDQSLVNKIGTSKGKMPSRLEMPFKNLSVHLFQVSGANIRLHSAKEEFSLAKGQMTVRDATLHQTGADGNKEFRFSAIACNLSDIHFPLPNSLYTVYIKELIADSKAEMLRINSLKIIPTYDKYELGKRFGHQEDWISTNVQDIEMSKLNYGGIAAKKLAADKITFNNCSMYVFRDRRLSRQLQQQPMPGGYLKKIPIEIRVNHLQMNHASVTYEEFPKDGNQPGKLQFGNMNISISPVFNHPYKTDPVYADTYVRGSIMNSGSINAVIHASIVKDTYFIKGAIENLDLTRLNSSAENLGKFHIESGILNSLDFRFTATDKKSSGGIVGEYHNLIIEKLNIKHGVKKVAKIPTFFLKHLIIPKNKDKSMNVSRRTGKINYDRDPTRAVTFYLLKSLLSGIRASFDFGFLLPE